MDFEKYINSKLHSIFKVVFYLLTLNLIFLFSSILGIVIFTFMPSLIALYIMCNSLLKNKEFPVFKAFFAIFKKEYVKSQKLFLFFVTAGIILYFDLQFFYSRLDNGLIYIIALWVMALLAVIYVITFINVASVYINLPRLTVYETIKVSLLFSIGNLFHSLLILIISVGFLVLVTYLPFLSSLIILFYFSTIACFTIFILRKKFAKLTNSNESLTIEDYL